MNQNISSVISFVRFPLAVMVVYVHSFGEGNVIVNEIDWRNFSCENLYDVIRVLVSGTISTIAVPSFFLISGYLFFYGLENWNWGIWRAKITRRIHTLMIPYLIWNVLRFLFNVLTMGALFIHGHRMEQFKVWLSENTDLFALWAMPATGMPVHTPFWFIRDLIVLVVLSPLSYFFLKKKIIGRIVMGTLLILYVGHLLPTIPGFSISGLLFFNLGCWLAIGKGKYLLRSLSKSGGTILVLSLLLIMLSVVRFGTTYNQYIIPWMVIFTIFAFYKLFCCIILADKMNIPSYLGDASFFIFAFHMFLIITGGLMVDFLNIPKAENPILKALQFLVIPPFVAFSCAFIHLTLKRNMPKLCNVLGR